MLFGVRLRFHLFLLLACGREYCAFLYFSKITIIASLLTTQISGAQTVMARY